MSIFVGVTAEEVGQMEDSVRAYLMQEGLDTSKLRIEARTARVYTENGQDIYEASIIVRGFSQAPVARSTYVFVKNEEGFFEVCR
jgi:hypothetical protein